MKKFRGIRFCYRLSKTKKDKLKYGDVVLLYKGTGTLKCIGIFKSHISDRGFVDITLDGEVYAVPFVNIIKKLKAKNYPEYFL